MIIIISGASHTGKTFLAQKLLEKYNFPYLSIDHLKMGLIRSNNTFLTPYSNDDELTNYLWPIVSEIIKTAIENKQNLIVEGCYIPFNYKDDFDELYLKNIKEYFLIMTEKYINNYFDKIINYGNIIENRLSNDINKETLIKDNIDVLKKCKKYNLNYILIEDEYKIDIEVGE